MMNEDSFRSGLEFYFPELYMERLHLLEFQKQKKIWDDHFYNTQNV